MQRIAWTAARSVFILLAFLAGIHVFAESSTFPLSDAQGDTMGMPPPTGADTLLAPGMGLEQWVLRSRKVPWMTNYQPGVLQWTVDREAGVATATPLTGSMDSRKHYGRQRVHVEFCTPLMKQGESPLLSGNSGVYLQGRYELQICNSHGIKLVSDMCGAVYKQYPPEVNAARKSGEWQVYDIYFVPATYQGGKKTAPARLSAKLNGQWVQRDVALRGSTGSGDPEGAEPGPLRLQEHMNPVQFRNVWVLGLDQPIAE